MHCVHSIPFAAAVSGLGYARPPTEKSLAQAIKHSPLGDRGASLGC
jgi:hypothetical protein